MESESALKNASGDEEEVDTDLETDRLLGHQRLEDHGFYEDKVRDIFISLHQVTILYATYFYRTGVIASLDLCFRHRCPSFRRKFSQAMQPMVLVVRLFVKV